MKISNDRAYHDYQILETFEAGINLFGAEVKAVRLGHADLSGTYVRIVNGEALLIGAQIFPYEYSRPENYDLKRTRKLLLHKQELRALKARMDGQNLTLVPLSMYTTRHYIKLQLGLGKGKKQYQKREAIKRKDLDRELEQAFRVKR